MIVSSPWASPVSRLALLALVAALMPVKTAAAQERQPFDWVATLCRTFDFNNFAENQEIGELEFEGTAGIPGFIVETKTVAFGDYTFSPVPVKIVAYDVDPRSSSPQERAPPV